MRFYIFPFLAVLNLAGLALGSADHPSPSKDFYDTPIAAQESKLNHLMKRQSHGYSAGGKKWRMDAFAFVENCVVGSATRIYDDHQKLSRESSGPIDLKYPLTFQSAEVDGLPIIRSQPYPDLYFEESSTRDSALEKLESLAALCQAMESDFPSKVDQTSAAPIGPLQVHHSPHHETRTVHLGSDHPDMKAALLTNGHNAYLARLYSLKHLKPEDHLRLQTLIFMADDAGIDLSTQLIEAAQKGVRIEIIFDALSSSLDIRDVTIHRNTKRMYHNMMAAGIPVHGYRCGVKHFLWSQIQLAYRYDKPVFDQRAHEKLWIVNEDHAIIGGMNIGNDYFRLNKHGFDFWRDQDLWVEGQTIVQDMINIFEGNRLSHLANYKDPREQFCFNPHDPVKDKKAYQKFYSQNYQPYRVKRIRPEKKEKTHHAREVIQSLKEKIHTLTKEELFPTQHLHAARIVHNRPKLHDLHIEETYIDMINRAQKEILIENAYFIPSVEIKTALLNAAKRGVRVVILTNSAESNDIPPIAIVSRHLYREYAEPSHYSKNPLEIWEWTGDSDHNGEIEQGTNHAKFMIVDAKVAFVGSYNLDPRSRNINSEVGIAFEDDNHKLIEEMRREFFNVDIKFSRRISYSEMIEYRKPLGFLKTVVSALDGYNFGQGGMIKRWSQQFFRIIGYIGGESW